MRAGFSRTYAFHEHLRAFQGVFLDDTQRRLLLQLPLRELHGHERVAAAILKARHDMVHWQPHLIRGLNGGSLRHLDGLREDIRLLEYHRASADTPGMHAIWMQTRRILQGWVPRQDLLRAEA